MSTRPFLIALLLVASAVVAACSPGGGQQGSGGELEGTDWILRSYALDGSLVSVAESEYADATFKGHQVSGDSGCNSYSALYRSGGRTLIVQPTVAATMMACAEETMAFEQAYLAGLTATRLYSVRRSELTTFDGNGDVALVFDAAPRNPLLGRWLVDSFQVSEGSVTAPIEGTELDVAFGIASVGGFSGCNSFSGTYGTNGNFVRVSPLATTRMACEQDVSDQEAAFLAALQGAAFIDSRGTTLTLSDISGDLTVALVRPADPEAGGSPAPSAEPTATAEPSASETPAPSATPEPTAEPTATPTPAPTPPPSLPPIPTLPPISVAECTLAGADADIATIAYPEGWSTLAEPSDLACRYFDPEEITVPDDPTTLSTAVMIQTPDLAYDDAVAAAIEPETWDVATQFELDSDVPITFVEAAALVDVDGTAAGARRAAYLIDLGDAGTLVMFTTGAPADVAYPGNTVVLSFMLSRSAFVTPA